jgi:hypothetical protein
MLLSLMKQFMLMMICHNITAQSDSGAISYMLMDMCSFCPKLCISVGSQLNLYERQPDHRKNIAVYLYLLQHKCHRLSYNRAGCCVLIGETLSLCMNVAVLQASQENEI